MIIIMIVIMIMIIIIIIISPETWNVSLYNELVTFLLLKCLPSDHSSINIFGYVHAVDSFRTIPVSQFPPLLQMHVFNLWTERSHTSTGGGNI